MALPGIGEATRGYEAWLGAQMHLIREDLDLKHKAMAQDVFPFLRATFYRWAQRWPHDARTLADAPEVLAVGDLHVENFGLWRDSEGRLVWGVNDIDEACRAPYTNDLLRLAVSAMLATAGRQLALDDRAVCANVLDGYRRALAGTPKPYVLAERHVWLRTLALKKLGDPRPFWAKLQRAPPPRPEDLAETGVLLDAALPSGHGDVRHHHRPAGLGSLGRPRVLAMAPWCGGLVAREAKAVAASGWAWAAGRDGKGEPVHIDAILAAAVRCPDPFLKLDRGWLVRRLAPDGSRLELAELPRQRDEARLLRAMGRETANVHAGQGAAREAIKGHIAGLDERSFRDTARRMRDAVVEDQRQWARAGG